MPSAVFEAARIHRTELRLICGDITDLDVDAFVFYAESSLKLGSGFGTAISVRGGPTIQQELDSLGPLATGQAVVSGAGNLKAQYIVHAVGPRFNEEDTEGKLRTTVRSALKAAEEKGVKRIALPPMGAGFYMVPLELCARVMVETVVGYLEGDTAIEEVILCAMDRREHKAFEPHVAALAT